MAKYPKTNDGIVSEKYYDVVSKLHIRYKEIRGELLHERDQLKLESLVSYDYDSHEIKDKFNALKILYNNNEHDVLFLENYPNIAARHSMGESWGTSSPR
jgi:hypothetical protein